MTVESFKPQPGEEHPLACPNAACKRTDKLVLLERATVATPAEFFDVGVTYPEIDKDTEAGKITAHGGRTICGVKCDACQWSAQGDVSVLSMLVRTS